MAERILAYKIVVTGTEAQVKELGRHDIAIKKLAGDTRLLEKRALELANQNKQGGIEFKGLTKKIGENRAKIIDLRNAKNSLAKTISNESKLNRTNANTIGQVNAQLAIEKRRINDVVVGSKRFNVIADRIKNLERRQRDFNAQLGRARTFTSRFSKSAVDAFTKAGLAIGGVLIALRTLQRITGGIINIFKDFQQANAELAAVLGKSRSEITELIEDSKRLGATTAFTASEVAKLQKEFAKLGFSTREILAATEATLDLAAATGADLAEAAKIAGATVRGFGLDASETIRVTDVMAKSFSSSALDIDKFQVAMSKIAPVAKAVGLTIEETTAFMGILSDSGIEASTVGTSLRKIFIELSKQGLTLNESLDKINNSQDKLNTAQEIFGIRAATSALVLADNADKAAELTIKLNEAGGAAKRMAEEQLDTLQGSTIKLSSAWEGFVLSLEDGEGAIAGTIRGVLDLSRRLLGLITVSDKNKEATIDLFDENTKVIQQSKNLVSEFETLSEKTEKTAQDKNRLAIITKDLSDIFGDSVVEINKETGAIELNIVAIIKQIAVRQALQSEGARELLADRLRLETKLKGIETDKQFLDVLKQRNDLGTTIISILNDESSAFGAASFASAELNLQTEKLSESDKKLVEQIRAAQRAILSESIQKTELERVNRSLLDSGIDLEELAKQSIATSGEIVSGLERENKSEKQLRKIREKFAEERRLALLTEEQRELDKLQKRVDELRKAGVEEVKISKFSVEETAKIREKFRQKEASALIKEIQDRVKAEQDGMALRLFILTQEFNEGIGIFKDLEDAEEKFKEEKLRIRKDTLEGIKEILEAEVNEMTASLEAVNIEESLLSDEQKEALILKIEEVKAKLSELERPTEDEEKLKSLSEILGLEEEQIEIIFEGINAVGGLLSEIGNLQNTITNERIKANDNETKSLTKNIDEQIAKAKEQGKNTDALEKQKQDIIDGNEAKNKIIAEEGFRRNKRLQISLALISGFQAVLAVLAAPPSTDLISDGIIRAIRIAAAVTTAGIQIANISKQTLKKGGILKGRSHEEGGIAFTVDGQAGFEAEGGEILVNKNIHSRPDFVEAISTMNHITGGKRFQAGAILPIPNITRIQQQAVFQDVFTREEAVELIQEGISIITVQQVESEVTETQKTVETIESGVEF